MLGVVCCTFKGSLSHSLSLVGFHCFNRTHFEFSFRANVGGHDAGNINAPKGVGVARVPVGFSLGCFIEQNSAFNLTCDLFVQTILSVFSRFNSFRLYYAVYRWEYLFKFFAKTSITILLICLLYKSYLQRNYLILNVECRIFIIKIHIAILSTIALS